MQDFRIASPVKGLELQLCCQSVPQARGDVLYVHGASFPSGLSLFFPFDGRSWADALNEAGFNAWGLDFLGYGRSDRYRAMSGPAAGLAPLGRRVDAAAQLQVAVAALQAHNGGRAIGMIAHSWGTAAAIQLAIDRPLALRALVLFGPVVLRRGDGLEPPPQAHRRLTIWEQYRRFVEDVPRGHAPVLLDRHFEAWAKAYLASDPQAHDSLPAAVCVPAGPGTDVAQLWSGRPLYDASRLRTPLLLVRGEWDSITTDADAAALLASAGSAIKRDVKLAQGSHLMHLESSRESLYQAANEFLCEQMGGNGGAPLSRP